MYHSLCVNHPPFRLRIWNDFSLFLPLKWHRLVELKICERFCDWLTARFNVLTALTSLFLGCQSISIVLGWSIDHWDTNNWTKQKGILKLLCFVSRDLFITKALRFFFLCCRSSLFRRVSLFKALLFRRSSFPVRTLLIINKLEDCMTFLLFLHSEHVCQTCSFSEIYRQFVSQEETKFWRCSVWECLEMSRASNRLAISKHSLLATLRTQTRWSLSIIICRTIRSWDDKRCFWCVARLIWFSQVTVEWRICSLYIELSKLLIP